MAGRKSIAGLVALLALGGYFTVTGAIEFSHSRRLRDHGRAITAQVLGQTATYGKRSRRYLTVTFTTDTGAFVTGRRRVAADVYNAAGKSGEVTARYLPEEPSVFAAGDTVALEWANLLTGLALLGLGAFAALATRLTVRRVAQRVNAQAQALCVGAHQYVPADPRRFPHLDLPWLDEGRRKLEEKGFTFLEDMEDLTVSASSSAHRTFLRVFTGGEGWIMASLYHFKPRWWQRLLGARSMKVLDLETELSDGTWICTSTSGDAPSLDSPPEISLLALPGSTPLESAVEAHEVRLAKSLAERPKVSPLRADTAEDVLQAQNRQGEIKAAFRRGKGISKEELERLAGAKSEQVDAIHAETVKLRMEKDSTV